MQLELTYSPPTLIPHEYPFPGMTGEDSAISSLSQSQDFIEVIADTVHRLGGSVTDAQVKAALPEDWIAILGCWAHASMAPWQAQRHGIRVEYVSHGTDGGFHWNYVIDKQGGEA